MSEEKKWSRISEELLTTAKGTRFVQKILENYSKLSCLETVLYDRFIIESSVWSTRIPKNKSITLEVTSRFLYSKEIDHNRSDLYDVGLLKEELISKYGENATLQSLNDAIRRGFIDQTDDTSFSKSYISLNTLIIEAHLLNICFDLKNIISMCGSFYYK